MSDENVHEASTFIIAELEKHGIDADLEGTGGGCTAVKIEVKHRDPVIETAYILITDVGGTTAFVDEVHEKGFLGWVAGYYPTEEALTYGEDVFWIHAQAYEREREVFEIQERDGAEAGRQAAERLRVDWRADAKLMVTGIVNYIADLKDSRD